MACAIEGCEREFYALGWCNLHWARNRANGDPGTMESQRWRSHWKGDEVTYAGLHARLRNYKGAAKNFPCFECGWRANDWAYDGKDPNEIVGAKEGMVRTFSTDLDFYEPLCRACHRRRDSARWVKIGVYCDTSSA